MQQKIIDLIKEYVKANDNRDWEKARELFLQIKKQQDGEG